MSKYLQALRVEQSKTFSDPSFALILLGLTAAMAIFPGLICHALSSDIASSDNSTARMYVFSFAGRIGYLAPLIVGIISFGADFKNGGFARMIMVYGSRFIAYSAKVTNVALLSIMLGLLSVSFSYGTIFTVAHLGSNTIGLDQELFFMALRMVLAYALWGILGAGLGALFKNQVVGISTVSVLALFIEPVLTMIINESATLIPVGKFLLGPIN